MSNSNQQDLLEALDELPADQLHCLAETVLNNAPQRVSLHPVRVSSSSVMS